MTASAQHLIAEFRALADADRREVVVALLQETLSSEYGAPDDDSLVAAAAVVFRELDQRESK